jgi:hypothetical protein
MYMVYDMVLMYMVDVHGDMVWHMYMVDSLLMVDTWIDVFDGYL